LCNVVYRRGVLDLQLFATFRRGGGQKSRLFCNVVCVRPPRRLKMVSAFSVIIVLASAFILPCNSCTDKIYAGILSYGLAISTNDGNTWMMHDPIPRASVNEIFAWGNDVYVTTEKGIAVSHTGGTTWKVVGSSQDANIAQRWNSIFTIENGV
jgi:hypothetical protein